MGKKRVSEKTGGKSASKGVDPPYSKGYSFFSAVLDEDVQKCGKVDFVKYGIFLRGGVGQFFAVKGVFVDYFMFGRSGGKRE